VLVGGKLMDLARWMSRYYVTTAGDGHREHHPLGREEKSRLGYAQIVRLAQSREQTQATLEKTKAPKRRAILARLLQLPPDGSIELVRLAGESGATAPTIRKLVRLGLITIRPEIDLPRLTADIVDSPATSLKSSSIKTSKLF
jgi:primosomal protein N'